MKREIENLTQFVLAGDSSDSVRRLLNEKEKELRVLQSKFTNAKSEVNTAQPVPTRWVRERLSDLKGLFSRYSQNNPLIRQELKNSLKGKITLRPVTKSGQRYFVAEGNGDPLSLLGSTVTIPLIGHSGGRI